MSVLHLSVLACLTGSSIVSFTRPCFNANSAWEKWMLHFSLSAVKLILDEVPASKFSKQSSSYLTSTGQRVWCVSASKNTHIKKEVAYFELVFRSGIAIPDLMLDWSPVMRLPLIYSFLINISKSFTIETRMRPAAGLSQRTTFLFFLFAPSREAKEKTNWKEKVLKQGKYFAINTQRGGTGGRCECWCGERSHRGSSIRNSPLTPRAGTLMVTAGSWPALSESGSVGKSSFILWTGRSLLSLSYRQVVQTLNQPLCTLTWKPLYFWVQQHI